MNLQPYARVIAYSYLLMPSDHEVNDAVADAGRDVEEERWDDHRSSGDPFGSMIVVADPSALAD